MVRFTYSVVHCSDGISKENEEGIFAGEDEYLHVCHERR